MIWHYSLAQKRWIGGTAGNWDNDSNWQPAGMPGNTDVVVLDNTFQIDSYTVILPNSAVNIHSLIIEPSDSIRIELILPASNISSPALIANHIGDAIVIKKGGIFRNSSGLISGLSIQINGMLRITNDGSYIHNTRSSHAADIVAKLSAASGTENGIFKFDVPGGSYQISVSNRTFGTLILSSNASGGTQTYNASGSNPVSIIGDLHIKEGVIFNLDLTKDMVIYGNYIQEASTFNLASQSNNNTVRIKGNISQAASAIISETSGGLPVIELGGNINQQVSLPGNIINSVALRINNPGGVTLINHLMLPFKLKLASGKLKTSYVSLLTLSDTGVVEGGSYHSFVDGPMKKTGDEDFEFPIGKQGDYAPVKISGPAGAVTDEFMAEYFLADPKIKFGPFFENPPIFRISSLEYWILERSTGTSSKKLSLPVGTYSNATALDKLVVARWEPEGTVWKNEGNSSYNGIATGTITSNYITAFGAFTLASTVETQNPLSTAALINLNVRKWRENFLLTWEINKDYSPVYFEIEKSLDGRNYTIAGTISANINESQYHYKYLNNSNNKVYVRLKIVEKNNIFFYSKAVLLPGLDRDPPIFRISPAIVKSKALLMLGTNENETIIIIITDMNGRTAKK